MSLNEQYEIAVNELKAIESAEGNIPAHRFNALVNFAEKRADDLLNELYPEWSE